MLNNDLSGGEVGHYRILSLLGRGGMGAVYRAFDTRLDRYVALKILPPELTGNSDRLRRFVQEAKTASALNHPHLVSIYEAGSEMVGSETIHYIAMELVEGETLRALASRKLDLRRVLEIMAQVADAMGAAHDAGIVHRDLKPENIIVSRAGYAKVLDFGLAKLRLELAQEEETQVRQTKTGVVLGTAGYMSPEQAEGQEADARSDVFALGCILYELVTGRRAFSGTSNVDTLHEILHAEPEQLARFRPDAPIELQRILSRTLAKDRGQRYQSVKDLAIDLRVLAREVEANRVLFTVSSNARLVGRRSGIFGAAVLIATASILLAVVLWVTRVRTTKKTATPSSIIMTRLTNYGDVVASAISPDGKLITYVVSDRGVQSLWIRQIATGRSLQLIPPSQNGEAFWSPTFTPDGNSIIYGLKTHGGGIGSFYQISILGGAPRHLLDGLDSGASFSPDGKRMAWLRADFPKPGQSALMIGNIDGTDAKALATRTTPVFFAPVFFGGPSWSPDGSTVAVSENRAVGQVEARLVGIDVASRHETVLSSGWRLLTQVAWLPDGSGLLAIASRNLGFGNSGLMRLANPQIWMIPLGGQPRPITNDLYDYRSVSLSADGRQLVSVMHDVDSSVWAEPINPGGPPQRLTQEKFDGLFGVAILPGGEILYSTLENGRISIVESQRRGNAAVDVTNGREDSAFPAASPDGRFFVYAAMTPTGTEIRRIDMGGRRAERTLAKGSFFSSPSISPDGKWVVFDDFGNLERVPSDGGEIVRYSVPGRVESCAVSPDGHRLALYYRDAKGLRLGVMPFGGGAIEWSREMVEPPIATGLGIKWSPDGKALFVIPSDDVSNVWLVPFEGTPRRITSFEDAFAGLFDVDSKGGTLVVNRQVHQRDAVLITDFR